MERALAISAWFDDEVAPDLRRLFWSTYFPHPILAARLATDGHGRLARAAWLALFPALRIGMRRNMRADRASLARAQARLGAHIDRLEAEIGDSGYLVGDRFGVADLTAAAVMTAILRPPEFPYPLPEPWPAELIDMRAAIAERDGCKWVMGIYQRHRGHSAEV